MGDWISFLRVNEVREQKRIADKENLQNEMNFIQKWKIHRGVVADQVPIAFFRVEFHGESARVSSRVGTATLTAWKFFRICWKM